MKIRLLFKQDRSNSKLSLPVCFGWVGRILLAFLILGVVGEGISLAAANTLSAAARPQPTTSFLLNPTAIVADFDNDNRPDLATIRPDGPHYKIGIQLSTEARVCYTMPRNASGLHVIVGDIDGDGYDDLIFFNGTSPQLLGIWLNDDGRHSRFEKGHDPLDSPLAWGAHSSDYQQNRDREAQVFIGQTHRLPFDRSTSSSLATKLEPKGLMPGESQQPSLQILSYTLQGRSPPLPPTL